MRRLEYARALDLVPPTREAALHRLGHAQALGCGQLGAFEDAALGANREGCFVLAGRYELYYFTFRATGTTIPRNLNAHLGCFIVP